MQDYPLIKSVIPLKSKRLKVRFDNGITKIYDCRPLLELPAFEALKEDAFFNNVQVDDPGYGIIWNDEVDLSEAELWVKGDADTYYPND